MTEFYSGVYIIRPGNFCSVQLWEVSGDYTIENEKEFLEKFYDVSHDNPFIMPTVTEKREDMDDLLFKVTRTGNKRYKISLTDAKRIVQNEESVSL